MEFSHKVEYPVYEFADDLLWPTEELRLHTKQLLQQKESANPRKEVELGREIGHCAFELARRDLERKALEDQMETESAQIG